MRSGYLYLGLRTRRVHRPLSPAPLSGEHGSLLLLERLWFSPSALSFADMHAPPPSVLPLFLPSLGPPPAPLPAIALSSPPPLPSSPFDPLAASFRPSIAVIIGVLTTMFSLTFLLLLYAKHCKRAGISVYDRSDLSVGAAASPAPPLPPPLHGRNSGVDRAIIDILPTFFFSSLHGLKDGLECAVCLSRFDTADVLRLLPKCKHAFHLECVDTWLSTHSTCPLCRNRVEADDVLFVEELVKCNSVQEPARDSGGGRTPSVGRNSQSEATVGVDRGFQVYVQRDCENTNKQAGGDLKANPSRKENLWKSSSKILRPGKAASEQQEFIRRFGHRIIITDALAHRRWSDFSPSDALFLHPQPIFARQEMLQGSIDGKMAGAPTAASFQFSLNSQAMKDLESDTVALPQMPRRSIGGRVAAMATPSHHSNFRTQDSFPSRLSASRNEAEGLSESSDAGVSPRLSSSRFQDMFLSRLSGSRRGGTALLGPEIDAVIVTEANSGKQTRGEANQSIFDRQASYLRRAFGRESSPSSSMGMPSYQRSVSEVSGIRRYAEARKSAALPSDEDSQWLAIARKTMNWMMGGGRDRPFLQMSGRPG